MPPKEPNKKRSRSLISSNQTQVIVNSSSSTSPIITPSTSTCIVKNENSILHRYPATKACIEYATSQIRESINSKNKIRADKCKHTDLDEAPSGAGTYTTTCNDCEAEIEVEVKFKKIKPDQDDEETQKWLLERKNSLREGRINHNLSTKATEKKLQDGWHFCSVCRWETRDALYLCKAYNLQKYEGGHCVRCCAIGTPLHACGLLLEKEEEKVGSISSSSSTSSILTPPRMVEGTSDGKDGIQEATKGVIFSLNEKDQLIAHINENRDAITECIYYIGPMDESKRFRKKIKAKVYISELEWCALTTVEEKTQFINRARQGIQIPDHLTVQHPNGQSVVKFILDFSTDVPKEKRLAFHEWNSIVSIHVPPWV